MPHSSGNSEYIAVDWGSTNRRAYRIAGDVISAGFEDSRGVLTIENGGFDEAVTEIRDRLGDHPMLLAGMIGSNKGWHNVPYVACPADVRDVAAHIFWADDRTGIVPGICQPEQSDTMRGEEVQAFGAVAKGLVPPNGVICLPGTHSKWVQMDGGRIQSFHTAMTGEVFGLMKDHSILADLLQGEAKVGSSFDKGASDGLNGLSLLSALFAIRARHLLGQAREEETSYASGLLIGSEVSDAARRHSGSAVTIVGRADLCELYANALSQTGLNCQIVDGGEAFVAGIKTLIGHLS